MTSLEELRAAWPELTVLRTLGRGSMGLVLLGEQRSLGRHVAIKVLSMDAMDDESIARFRREARSYAALSHPHLVRIFDADLDGAIPRIVLEYIDGNTLVHHLQLGEKLPVIRIGRELSGALAYVHEKGFLHRDVKPSNVMIRSDGSTVLMDLGLSSAPAAIGPELTAEGIVVGTMGYLSPEVLRGGRTGAASDVYALGLTLYEAARGRISFTGEDAIKPLQRLRDEIPPLDEDSAVWKLIRSCLALDPTQRPTAAALHEEFSRLARGGKDDSASAVLEAEHAARAAGPPRPNTVRMQPKKRRIHGERDDRPLVRGLAALAAAWLLLMLFAWSRAPGPGPARSPSAAGTSAANPSPELPARLLAQDGSAMVLVPAGSFWMGSTGGPADQRPRHGVTLSAYYIDVTEVTNAQYDRFCRETGRKPPTITGQGAAVLSRPEHPVVCVRWPDAKAYCEWAGKRLPTEAEWERAARGPNGADYPWGPWKTGDVPRANVQDKSWANRSGAEPGDLFRAEPVNDGFPYSAPVGSFPAGAAPSGALDMAGNVSEWCQDFYDAAYYASSPARDPRGPANGDAHVVRGGSWRGPARDATVTVRDRYRLERGDVIVGFRGVTSAQGR